MHKNSISKSATSKWLTFQEVQQMFNYRSTQMATLLKLLVVSKVGKRKFILRESLEKLLEQCVLQ